MLSPKNVLRNAKNELKKIFDDNLAKGRLMTIFEPSSIQELVFEAVLNSYRKLGWTVEFRERQLSNARKFVVHFVLPGDSLPKKPVGPSREWLEQAAKHEDKVISPACGVVPRTHPKPVITGDNIVIEGNKILLIEREKEPFKGCWALPGGHFDIDTDQTILDCAIRELGEECNIILPASRMTFVGYWDKPNRDPRGRYVGFCWACEVTFEEAFKAKAGDDAKKLTWFPIDSLPKLAFDHKEMVEKWQLLQRYFNDKS